MKLRQKSCSRNALLRRRAHSLLEALEERRLFSLLGVSLSAPPLIAFGSNSMTYSAATGDLTTDSALTLSIPPSTATPPGIVHLDIKVDNTGTLTGPSTSADVVVTDQTGTILTGQVTGFGYQFIDAQDAAFDFTFHVTGGSLQSQFANSDIGVVIQADISTFTGSFSSDFQTDVKGTLGPIPTQTQPSIDITKSASAQSVSFYQPVTYTYTVTNPGNVPLTSVTITDDNGTPANLADDFHPAAVTDAGHPTNVGDANNNGLLDPGEAWTFQATLIPAIPTCVTANGTTFSTGTLQIVDLGSSYHVTFLQDRGIVDNVYGTPSVPDGWPSGHKFNDLVGSDHAEFKLTNGSGATVLDFKLDYVSQSSAFTSGYGTLGFSGGDGGVISGSPSLYVSNVHTTFSDDLNAFAAAQLTSLGLTTNSPAETSPGSGISSNPTFAGWNYVDGYSFDVSKSAFGASGLGAITIPDIHNSPAKHQPNQIVPQPCPTDLTNNAVVTAITVGLSPNQQLSAGPSFAVVHIGPPPAGASSVTASNIKIAKNLLSIDLTNTGTSNLTIQSISLTWPTANGKLQAIKLGAKVIFNKVTPPGSLTVSTFAGAIPDRTINAGAKQTLVLQFEKNAALTGYSLDVTLSDGTTVHLNI